MILDADPVDRSAIHDLDYIWTGQEGLLAKKRHITVEVPERVAKQVEQLVEASRGTTLEAYIENQLGEMAGHLTEQDGADEGDDIPEGSSVPGYV